MRTLFYNTNGDERNCIENAAGNTKTISFLEAPLNPLTVANAESFDAVSIAPEDEVSSDVLWLLYKNGIRFIAIRGTENKSINTEEAATLGITIATVPGNLHTNKNMTGRDVCRYIADVTLFNLSCHQRDLASGNESGQLSHLVTATVYCR